MCGAQSVTGLILWMGRGCVDRGVVCGWGRGPVDGT